MTNKEALKAQCKLICNTCYVDADVLEYSLMCEGIEADAEAFDGSAPFIPTALRIVKGWVETSRSESGISVSIDMATLRNNIKYWCNVAGLDASEFIDDSVAVENGTTLW